MRAELVINWENYEEHLDEAAFLWSQWERSLVAPDYVLAETLSDEERLLARLDALRLGGAPVATRLLVPALESDEAERVAAAAHLLLTEDVPAGGGEAVRAALETAAPPVLAALGRALELLEPRALPDWVVALLDHQEPHLRALSLGVLCAHGMDPGPGLAHLLRHEHPQVLAAALRASGRLRLRPDPEVLPRALASPAPEVRDAAIETGLLQGQHAAWAACQKAVMERAPRLRLPALLLALGGDVRDLEHVRGLLTLPEHLPDALWALGFSGRVSGAEACLDWLETEAVAPLAAEAFCAITGLRLEGPFVATSTEPPDAEEGGLDEDLSLKPERALPLPQPGAVAAWWSENRKHFQPVRRYLYGSPFTAEALREALWEAPMRRRHALALELTLRSRGTWWPPTRAFSTRQFAALRALPETFGRAFAEGPLA
ncbi:TIGR02270 family protein [Corallococcus sp. CA047B]|uniref:TIGR02270 family protein n=1 Tax=Corallococcus sp. CA047B TaxID=2316729 RepID=UPI000EA33616|nr:TIGR02270 family protein [Corallococcus sp. CA047B]RKH17813.1 TIGR02270 family protein [Corallococcus sp. CA047B]